VSWQRKKGRHPLEKVSAISMYSFAFLHSRHIGPVLGGKVRQDGGGGFFWERGVRRIVDNHKFFSLKF